VNNGWLLVPEECDKMVTTEQASQCIVFKTLQEFSDEYPKRERRKKTKTTIKVPASEAGPQHVKD
jgi:hypothetical protein